MWFNIPLEALPGVVDSNVGTDCASPFFLAFNVLRKHAPAIITTNIAAMEIAPISVAVSEFPDAALGDVGSRDAGFGDVDNGICVGGSAGTGGSVPLGMSVNSTANGATAALGARSAGLGDVGASV